MPYQANDKQRAILSDESLRMAENDVRQMNLTAARSVGTMVRTTLGPWGMDKLLVDSDGNVVITNDGVTLIEEMNITHPTAKLIADVASTQETAVGDGTTSAVVLASELIAASEDLLDRGIHPTTIVSGYQRAAAIARKKLVEVAIPVASDTTLEQVATTAMTGSGGERDTELLAETIAKAVRTATRDDGIVDHSAIDVRTFSGGSVGNSRFIHGVLVDKDPPHPAMPTSISDASVLVYEGGIEISETERNNGVAVDGFDDVSTFVRREQTELSGAIDRIVDTGTDVVLAGEGIDEDAQQQLATAGILALRRTSDEDRARVAAVTGATRINTLDTASSDDLGTAGRIEQQTIRQHVHTGNAPPEQTFVFDDGENREHATVLLRGGTIHVLDEVERVVESSIRAVSAAVEDDAILPGGGSTDIALSLAVRDAASAVNGREQLAVEAFANALEARPRTLAETAGYSVIDALIELRTHHDAGERVGLAVGSEMPTDTLAAGVVEPRRVTEIMIKTAVETATMILRIDDGIFARDLSDGDTD